METANNNNKDRGSIILYGLSETWLRNQTKYCGYRWIITKDHISGADEKSAVGTQGPRNSDDNLKSNPQRFSLWDDDGDCYAEGMLYSTDEEHNYEDAIFSPLDNFGTPNWGCTAIKIDGEYA